MSSGEYASDKGEATTRRTLFAKTMMRFSVGSVIALGTAPPGYRASIAPAYEGSAAKPATAEILGLASVVTSEQNSSEGRAEVQALILWEGEPIMLAEQMRAAGPFGDVGGALIHTFYAHRPPS